MPEPTRQEKIDRYVELDALETIMVGGGADKPVRRFRRLRPLAPSRRPFRSLAGRR